MGSHRLQKTPIEGGLKSFDFRSAPKCPYGKLRWNKYYWEYPRPIPQYERDYWGQATDPDGKIRDMQSKDEWKHQVADIQWIADIVNTMAPTGRILDVGCGPGYFLSRISSTWERHGLDISTHALNSARKFAKVKHGGLPGVVYPDGSFDVVNFSHVIEHVADPVGAVAAIRNVLKPGGIFILATPDFDSGCARRFGTKYRMLHDKGHINLFTSFSLVKLLEDFKFRVLTIEYPFFESVYFSKKNLVNMLDSSRTSPPFYGNHVVIFSEKV